MTSNAMSRPGSDTETAHQASASKLDDKDTPDTDTTQRSPLRQRPSNGALMTVEHKLLAMMTTPDGMAEVIETGLTAAVFEDPIHTTVFDFMRDYWSTGHTPPTAMVLEAEYPAVALPRASEVAETPEWLIGWLQKRHARNKLQDVARQSAMKMDEDPAEALRMMRDGASLALEQTGRTGPPHLRDRLLSVSGLGQLTPVKPLVNGLVYRDTVAQISGPPGCYKSFVAVGIGCSVATGHPFAGTFTVPQAGRVVYVAAEGASGLRARVLAWCEAEGFDPEALDGQLFVLPDPIQLGNPAEVAQAVEVVQDLDADLLIFDTRARSTVGLEENSATDQGRAIDAADKIRTAAGCTVLAIHHAARNGSAGRGSNAWDGAVWSDLRMEGEARQAKIHCAKHKDVADGCDHHLSFLRHTVSADLMPNTTEMQRQTLVVSNSTAGLADLLANSELVVLEIVRTAAPPEGLSGPQIVDMAKPLNISRSSVYAALKALLKDGAPDGELVNVGTPKRTMYAPRSGGA